MRAIIHKNQIQEGGLIREGAFIERSGAKLNHYGMWLFSLKTKQIIFLNQLRCGLKFCMMIVLARINTAKHDDSLIDLRGISFLLQIKSNFIVN